MEKQKRIIWGFPGSGKSTFVEHYSDLSVIDADCEMFKYNGATAMSLHSGHGDGLSWNENYPRNYIDYVKNVNVDVVLINCHLSLLKEFESVEVVYPEKNLKEEYLQRYKERGDDEGFIAFMNESFEQMVDMIEGMYGVKKSPIDKEGMYMSDVMENEKMKRKDEKLVYSGEIVDLCDGDRCLAIMVADGKMYISDSDHQDCFEQYCQDIGVDSGLDWSDPNNYDEVQEEAIKITNSLFEDEDKEIYGFDVFYDGDELYLTSHFPHNMEKCYEMMRDYAKENDYVMATFYNDDCRDYRVKIVDKEATEKNMNEKMKLFHVEYEVEFECADEKMAHREAGSYTTLINGVCPESIKVETTEIESCEEIEFENESLYYMAVQCDVKENNIKCIEENIKEELYGLCVRNIEISERIQPRSLEMKINNAKENAVNTSEKISRSCKIVR